MALQTTQSPFALNTSLWSSEELLTYNTAYARAEKIQLSIDQIFSNIINTPKFEKEFPALALSMKALVIPLKDTNLPDELKWIKEDVMKLFKSKETIAITTELAHKIAKAQEGITEYLENYNNDETNKLAASIFFIQPLLITNFTYRTISKLLLKLKFSIFSMEQQVKVLLTITNF